MDIVLNNSISTPLYLQVYEQIVAQIISGALSAHFCLPSIRNIARELDVSVITIKNAYEMLEREGYIYTITGKGCFVAPIKYESIKTKLIDEEIQRILRFCEQYNIETNEVLQTFKKYLNQN